MKTFTELLNTINYEIGNALSVVDSQALENFCTLILHARRIFIAGKGRSGLQMRGFAMRLMHLGLQVYVVDDVTTPAIKTEDLLIIGLASGNTKSLVQYAGQAKHGYYPDSCYFARLADKDLYNMSLEAMRLNLYPLRMLLCCPN